MQVDDNGQGTTVNAGRVAGGGYGSGGTWFDFYRVWYTPVGLSRMTLKDAPLRVSVGVAP